MPVSSRSSYAIKINKQFARGWLRRLSSIPGGHEWPKLTPGPGTDDKNRIQFRNEIKRITIVSINTINAIKINFITFNR